MTRRRLILAIVAAVLIGMVWWLSLDRLSAEERLLVGTWTYEGKSSTGLTEMRFESDRRSGFVLGGKMSECRGPWFFRDGEVLFDSEPNAVRRALRPILDSVGLPSSGAIRYRLTSITADEMVLLRPDGTRETWTRAPAD
jgi:hypothetical protein